MVLKLKEVIEDVDVMDVVSCECMVKVVGGMLDIVVNNAGYFYEFVEKVTDGSMAFDEELKMIDICVVGLLCVLNVLYNVGKIIKGGKIVMVIL